MAPLSRLAPGDLADALESILAVVVDHAAALDRLDLGEPEPLDPATDELDPGGDSDPERVLGAGTDLQRSLEAVVSAVGRGSGLPAVLDAFAAARATARAQAGLALAAVLDGIAEASRNADHLDGARLAIGLELAAEHLGGPEVGPPRRGSTAAVAAAAADAALGAVDEGAALADIIVAAADDGLDELEAGPTSDPDLMDRGVVDAAAAGLLLVLDALSSVVTGDPLPSAPLEPLRVARPVGRRYRVRCAVEPHDGADVTDLDLLGATLVEIGSVDTLEVDGSRWSIEVTTNLPGTAIEVIVDAGRPRDLRVEFVESAEHCT